MWSLGLLAYSWLFLQTIGSAHFSRGMSSDRPAEQMSSHMYQNFNEIRIRLNYTRGPRTRLAPGGTGANGPSGTAAGGGGGLYTRTYWDQSEHNNNFLLHPRVNELHPHVKNLVVGQLVVVRNVKPKPKGSSARRTNSVYDAGNACGPILNPAPRAWIALVADGGCSTETKVANLFEHSNASGIIVFGDKDQKQPKDLRSHVGTVGSSTSAAAAAAAAGFGGGGVSSKHRKRTSRTHQLAVWVKYSFLKNVINRCNNLTCNATLMVTVFPTDGLINRTSVLFVSISFILLMIISLAWLVFYYVQRFRYIHAKERLSRRLANAAKKALTKIPVKTLLRGDQETENEYDQCAVCIEHYKPSDTIRILPCRHYFHKSCIDPWLLEQRSCPMCKLDILKAYGLQVRGFSEGPSDTLAEHSEVNALGGRTTSVSLDAAAAAAGRDPSATTAAADDSPDTAAEDTRLVPDERLSIGSGGAGGGGASPGASSGGVRVTIEPPEVQYHLPAPHGRPAAPTELPAEAAGGATVEVHVEQHAPRTAARPAARDEDEEEEEEDEESAATRPLVGLDGPAPSSAAPGADTVVTEC